MNESPKMFNEESGLALRAQSDAAAVARATQEIQAALVIGQRAPRDDIKCKARIIEACKRKDLAEVAEYEYSRGGTKITGPTIDLLRAIANRWGNIRFGWTEVDRRDGVSSIRCFAWDVQTNSQSERTFTVKHWRDTREGGYKLEDERDIYELLANQASRRVRACLEEVIDADMINAAIDQCRITLKTGEKISLKDRAVQMLDAFQEFGVTQVMIETRLGNKLEAISENQFASLRRVFKSLKDGIGKREDYFKPETTKPEFKPEPSATESKQSPEETPTPLEKPAESGANPLKALRGLLKLGKIKEGDLLDYWQASGVTDGSSTSLEEVQMATPEVILATYNNWAVTEENIKKLKVKE